jgi:hypothetical protein
MDQKQLHGKSQMPGVLSIILTIGIFFWMHILAFISIPEENKSLLFTLLGSYTSAWLMCVGYYVGTTFGSSTKDNMLYRSTPNDIKHKDIGK